MIKMRQLVFKYLLFLLFLTSNTFSQSNIIDSLEKGKPSHDTLNINHIGLAPKPDDNPNKNMPWIVALSIGIISSITTLYLGYRQRKSSRIVLDRQLKSNIDILEKQLAFIKDSLLLQFKGNIASKNRQDWINDLRNCLSEIISKSAIIILEKKNSKDEKQIQADLDRLLYLKSKIELLLNHNKPEQIKVKNSVRDLIKILQSDSIDMNIYGELQNNLILDSRELFQIHWEKIKNLK